MRYARYLLFDIFGGFLWVCAMVLAGYTLGKKIPNIQSKIHWVIAAVIIISLIPAVIEGVRVRRKEKNSQAEPR